jgi:Arc/MetJ family transcription regulator
MNPYNMSINMAKEVEHMPRMVKKTIELDQDHIDMARRIFGVRTDKQAVNKALEMVIIDNQIIEAHESVAGQGDLIEEIFK